ncbi:M23 family peptidase, partial [Xanthomonas oryzae pv. oryzae]
MVGTTGNARGTPPHLHYGVYGRNGVYDPLPLLRKPAPQPEN